ncbi:hypothetical protein BamIOP4010DRAFT_4088 [Burkholderia ambifaria IOP40-10]|uniref:Uncharacterized protein n=1 Tax=Burkholderia ambifaria IOP40-10 TaxID=396596 RepID=B1FJ77_9BURK|nr:hypothetical protein BamIOP4010DRAFT_4088 [Burkholderia ambifaria IOP40-10]
MPSGAPSGRASTIARSASAFEQNHLSPYRRHTAPPCACVSRTARVAMRPTSEPAACSVMNIAPWNSVSKSRDASLGR